jgi:CheY-like chemotaxis protein
VFTWNSWVPRTLGSTNAIAMSAYAQARAPLAQILFVDDDPVLRQLTPGLLEQAGYVVRAAENGIDGLQKIKERLPDLIISDLRMPKMSGFEFLSIVRRRFPQVPLIAISGEFSSSTDPILGIADAFFCKGQYAPQVLCNKIAELLKHPPARKHLDQPPMWVAAGPHGQVVLTCTDCLRSFPVRACPSQFAMMVFEVECVACGTKLRYCVDTITSKILDCPALRISDAPAD